MTASPLADSATLLPLLERLAGRTVWIVGDVMLDEYVSGPVERISPEAPVPIVRVRDSEYRLGGAANVARQIAALGGQAVLAGMVGDDVFGDRLLHLCQESGIDARAVGRVPGRCTTRKLRVLAGHQQLMRLDWEETTDATAPHTERLLGHLDTAPPPDALILSDYAKGTLTPLALAELVRRAERLGCPLIVDPKHADFHRYWGATHLTPNLRELEAAVGRRVDSEDLGPLTDAARTLTQSLGLEGLVVTRGERGMLVVPKVGPEAFIAGTTRAVFDITGAGDTAIAVLGLALAAGAPLVAAAQLANAAAGLSVEQVGTAAIEPHRLREALVEHMLGKVLGREELAAKAATWRLSGQRIVFTNGCFDLLHAGHLSLLQQAARLGDKLIVAINSDTSVRRLKGSARPLVSEQDRAAILGALTYVDAVTIYEEDTPLRILERALPHILVKGGDYRLDQVIGRDVVEAKGGRVVLIPLVPEKSTSSLVERITRSSPRG